MLGGRGADWINAHAVEERLITARNVGALKRGGKRGANSRGFF